MPFQKELHYFDQLNTTPEHYLKRFQNVSKEYKTGEITPSYLNVPHAPLLAKSLCPQSQIFVVLRNPVERAFSHWKVALWSEGKIPHGTSFITAFEEGHPWGPWWHSIKERGLYINYLQRWYNEFPEKQIKILWYEDIKTQPEAFIKELYEWLGVNGSFLPKNYKKKYNENWSKKNPEFKEEDRKKVLDYYLPSIEKLEKFTGKDLTNWKK